jgi:hypothetical protein
LRERIVHNAQVEAYLAIFEGFRKLDAPVATTITAIENAVWISQPNCGRNERISKEPLKDIMLGCQPVFFPIVIRNRHAIYLLVHGYSLEDPPMNADHCEVVPHAALRSDSVSGVVLVESRGGTHQAIGSMRLYGDYELSAERSSWLLVSGFICLVSVTVSTLPGA